MNKRNSLSQQECIEIYKNKERSKNPGLGKHNPSNFDFAVYNVHKD